MDPSKVNSLLFQTHATMGINYNPTEWEVKWDHPTKKKKVLVYGKYTSSVNKAEFVQEMSHFQPNEGEKDVAADLLRTFTTIQNAKSVILDLTATASDSYNAVTPLLTKQANDRLKNLADKLKHRASNGPFDLHWDLEYRNTRRSVACNVSVVDGALQCDYSGPADDEHQPPPRGADPGALTVFGKKRNYTVMFMPEDMHPPSKGKEQFPMAELETLESVLSSTLDSLDMCGMGGPDGLPPWAVLAHADVDGASCERHQARLAVLRMVALDYVCDVQLGDLWSEIVEDLDSEEDVPLAAFAGLAETNHIISTLNKAISLLQLDISSAHVISEVPIVNTYYSCLSAGILALYKLPNDCVETEPMEFTQSKSNALGLMVSKKKQALELPLPMVRHLANLTDSIPLLALQPSEVAFVQQLHNVATTSDLCQLMAKLPGMTGPEHAPSSAFTQLLSNMDQLPPDITALFKEPAPALPQPPQPELLLLKDHPDSGSESSDDSGEDDDPDGDAEALAKAQTVASDL